MTVLSVTGTHLCTRNKRGKTGKIPNKIGKRKSNDFIESELKKYKTFKSNEQYRWQKNPKQMPKPPE